MNMKITKEKTGELMELSFGEQIKILLKRKNMTIQDLATLYEQQTGSKMSRQNLTQRLKRDNFPEQDMHIIAALLGYNVSIQLTPVTVQLPEFIRVEAAAASFRSPADNTPAPAVQPSAPDTGAPRSAPTPASMDTPAPTSAQDSHPTETPPVTEPGYASPNTDNSSGFRFQIPELFRRNRPQGDINPLTGEEYLTNTVRRHPDIEEFVQVYDQSTHSWSDVREDYFWEFQEKKKQMLGKDYRAPIRI